jgi:hypothetical protein
MKQYGRRKRQQNQGVAMIVAMVVGVVLMVFALSLLLISYTLFSSAVRQSSQTKCRELAKSLNRELQLELTTPNYGSYEEQMEAINQKENNFWSYLRYNVWQDSWPSYDEENIDPDCYRYFTMDASEFDSMVDSVMVTLYWEKDTEEADSEANEKANTILHVKIEAKKGESAYISEAEYELSVSAYPDAEEEEEETSEEDGNEDGTEGGASEDENQGSTLAGLTDSSINPDNNQIDTQEYWVWSPN